MTGPYRDPPPPPTPRSVQVRGQRGEYVITGWDVLLGCLGHLLLVMFAVAIYALLRAVL